MIVAPASRRLSGGRHARRELYKLTWVRTPSSGHPSEARMFFDLWDLPARACPFKALRSVTKPLRQDVINLDSSVRRGKNARLTRPGVSRLGSHARGSSRLLNFHREGNHLASLFWGHPLYFLPEAIRNVELNHLCHSILRSNRHAGLQSTSPISSALCIIRCKPRPECVRGHCRSKRELMYPSSPTN
jgi:hypothetical protein